MTDFETVRKTLQANLNTPAEALAALPSLPPESYLIGAIVDAPFQRHPAAAVDAERAWELVWLVLKVGSGVPLWSSRLIERLISECRSDSRWGGTGTLYTTLLRALPGVPPSGWRTIGHFLRELGRACRAGAHPLRRVPRDGPYTSLESLALLYAPGAEHFGDAFYREIIAGAIDSPFAEEVRAALEPDSSGAT